MKRFYMPLAFFLPGLLIAAGMLLPQPALAQFGGTAEQIAKQLELEKNYPK